MSAGWGYFLALATVGALIGAGVLLGDLLLLSVGALGALQALPATVLYFLPGALAAPLALLAGGVVLITVAVWAARRGLRR
jgi:hypothetical protein